MAFVDKLGWFGRYLKDRKNGLFESAVRNWRDELPDNFTKMWSGVWSMATALTGEDGQFAHGARNWLDGLVGTGVNLFGGTVGLVGELPAVHETLTGLDRAYRYGIARPGTTSYALLMRVNQSVADDFEAGRLGRDDIPGAFFDRMLSWDNVRQAWNDTESETPGQAIVWSLGSVVGALGNGDDPWAWSRAHDPRIEAGHASYDSPDADFLLKYASGTLDLTVALTGDPSHGLSGATKAAKLRFVDRVATPQYVASGRVLTETNTENFRKLHQLYTRAKTPEEARRKVMPNATFGGPVSTTWWAAARMGEDVFRDAYLVARGMDMGAWARLRERAPAIASDFARIFANWNIGDDALMIGRDEAAGRNLTSLARTDTEAFIAALIKNEGVWGRLPGSLLNEKMPKVSRSGLLRAGWHSWVLHNAPIVLGRPVARALSTLLPSQGYTPFIDADDATGLGLRQFRANLERAGLPEDRIDRWVSVYGAKSDRSGRFETVDRAEDEAIAHVAAQHGVTPEVVKAALVDINRYRAGYRQVLSQSHVYLSDAAARLGARLVADGRLVEGKAMRDLSQGLSAAARRGEIDDAHVALPDIDGHTSLVPVPDPRTHQPHEAPTDTPLLSSQLAPLLMMVDYRQLSGALRFYRWQRRFELEQVEEGIEGISRTPRKNRDRASLGRLTLSQAAKLRSAYDFGITALDFANMVWKASALTRPAQMPRNLADDVLRRMLVFGKLDLLMGSAAGSKRAIQNVGRRYALVHERVADTVARRKAARDSGLPVDAEIDETATAAENLTEAAATGRPGELPGWQRDVDDMEELAESARQYAERLDKDYLAGPNDAWYNGAISFDDFVFILRSMFDSEMYQNLPTAIRQIFDDESRFELARDVEAKPDPMERVSARRNAALKAANRAEAERRIAAHFLRRRGSRFLDPEWRKGVLQQLVDTHRRRRDAPGFEADPYRPAEIAIDPLRGTVPEFFDGSIAEHFDVVRHRQLRLFDRPSGGGINVNRSHYPMMQYIMNNLDEIMKPNHLFGLSIDPEGHIVMSVLRAKEHTAANFPIKVSAKQRFKNLRFGGLLDAGHSTFDLMVNGVPHTFGAFLGESGEVYQRRVSTRGVAGSYAYLVGDLDVERMMDQTGGFGVIQPHAREYDVAWERVVNAELAGDEVARMLLEGKTDSAIINWLETTREGTKYIRRMHFRGVNYVDHVHQVEGLVRMYVPAGETKAHRILRQAVLERSARRRDHLDKVLSREEQPEVHGATVQHILNRGAGAMAFRAVTRSIDWAQKMVSDLPTDIASRYPFFNLAYRKHLKALLRTAEDQYGQIGEVVPTHFIEKLNQTARERALYDTKYTLYDVAQHNDLARLVRLVIPFSSAAMDATIKYGRLLRDNPALIAQGLYYWNTFEREQMIQDENGYVLRADSEGHERWYAVDPDTDELTEVPAENVGQRRYVQFRLPSNMAKLVRANKLYGVEARPVLAVNKDSFNVFLAMPATGPMVAIPANQFSLKNPEFAEADIIKKIVLPYGPSASPGRVFIPSNVRSAWEAFNGEDGNTAEGQAKAIYQAELIAYGRGERQYPPSIAEVRQKAASLKGLRFLATWVSPVSFQTVSPYQPYVDAYRQMVTADPEGAAERFMAEHGQEFYAVQMSVTRNIAGVRASLDSQKSFLRHKDLIAAYPELAGLIVGRDGGAFSKAVYEAQKTMPVRPGSNERVREVMSLNESVNQLERDRVWTQYVKMMDLIEAQLLQRGASSLRGRGVSDLAAIRNAFVANNQYWYDPVSGEHVLSPWYRDFMMVDEAGMQARIEGMWRIVQDPDLQKRDDIRGLISYLSLREGAQAMMKQRGVKSLANKSGADIRASFEARVHTLLDTNPAFGQLYSRWLSNDTTLEDLNGAAPG